MSNYDYWRTTSDIDYEDSCNTECYDTEEDYINALEVLNNSEVEKYEIITI